MSYQKRKLKKTRFSQLKYQIRLAKTVLFQFFKKRQSQEVQMRLPQTTTVMRHLRERSRAIRPNNLKISDWVDNYIDGQVLGGKPIDILTQWCLSKSLERRYQLNGNVVIPTKRERELFAEEIPKVAELFDRNGLRFNWWLTFNRSYLDSGRINPELERLYIQAIQEIAGPLINKGYLMVVNWEDDILNRRSEPDQEVLGAIESFVAPAALQLEIQRHSSWAREEAGLTQSETELKRDVYLQIACEAAEGILLNENSPIGEFVMIPLEAPERYDFFTIRVPNFKRRIVSVLPLTPWRLKDNP